MKKTALWYRRSLSTLLSIGLLLGLMPANIALAASVGTVYAAAYQNASDVADTTLPATVSVAGSPTSVEWSIEADSFYVPYETVQIKGSAGGSEVIAQVEVIPAKENDLVYFIDASMDSAGHNKASVAYDSVAQLSKALVNKAADGVYSSSAKWGRTGSNFSLKSSSGIDLSKKIQSGWYSKSKTESLKYKLYLEAGTYTLSAGSYEWWNNRSVKYAISGSGIKGNPVSSAVVLDGQGSSGTSSVSFTVDTACEALFEAQNATGGEAPVVSWLAIAKGTFTIPVAPIKEEIVIKGSDVEAAAANVNGLTYKGFGVLSGNSTSNLLMDYKAQTPAVYQQMLQTLFGGKYPIINHVKIEMGNDGNNSTGSDSCTMRTETEEADASRSPGWQLAADAKKVNPNVKVSVLRWSLPSWVQDKWNANTDNQGYEAFYKWYSQTIFDAYEKYGYIVDYINPDTNETENPNEELIKWFAKRVETETNFPSYFTDAAKKAYNSIKIVASDENKSLNIVPSMRNDAELYSVVDAIGFHYRTDSTADYVKMAEVDDKEIWYSEGCAAFSYSEYQENKNTSYGGGTMGGFQSPLGMGDAFIKSFVESRKTHYIFQPAIGSFYEGAQYDHKELLSAREPWAGYVHYDASLNVVGHFAKFAKTGWENDDNTSGIWRAIKQSSATGATATEHLSNQAGKPSYLTLAAPDKSNFSVIALNNSDKALTYKIKTQDMGISATAPLEIWETKTDSYMQYKGEAAPKGGYYTVQVAPFSVVTITSLNCSDDPDYTAPLPSAGEKTVLDTDASGKDIDTASNILYADDFEYATYGTIDGVDYLTSRGNEPRYFVDLTGAWEVDRGDNNQLVQRLTRSVGQWNPNEPNTTVGDFRWMNYKASVDVTVTGASYAGINIRQQTGMGFNGSGYNLRIFKNGYWELRKGGTVVSSGNAEQSEQGTYNIALEGKGSLITAYINNEAVSTYIDESPALFGRVRFGSGYETTYFDNLKIEKINGYTPYASQLIDSADDLMSYDGNWSIMAGGNGSNNDWYRSTSTSSSANSSISFPFNGTSFALVGSNDGTAVVDIYVDGILVHENMATKSSAQHYSSFVVKGISSGSHTAKIVLKSGKLVSDAIYIIDDVAPVVGDIVKLQELATSCETIVQGNYTQASWDAFTSALTKAKDVLAQGTPPQENVETAYFLLKSAFDGLIAPNTDEPQAAPILDASSSNGYTGLSLFGNAVKTIENGGVLSLDGTFGSYAEIKNDTLSFDGRNSYTVSFDVKTMLASGNFFTFTMGKSDKEYMFARTRGSNAYVAITKGGSGGEEKISKDDSSTLVNRWATLTITAKPGEMSMYLDGSLLGTMPTTVNTVDFGKNVKAYFGRSFYSADSYFKGQLDNIKVYNRTLDAAQVAELFTPNSDKIIGVAEAPQPTATIQGNAPALPETVQVATFGAGNKAAKVAWHTDGVSFDKVYDTVAVTGTVENTDIEATILVEVVPAGLVYFMDTGSQNNTPVHATIKALIAGVKNNSAHQIFNEADGWGYVNDGISSKEETASTNRNDKYVTGIYAGGSGSTSKPILYKVTLAKGVYNIAEGFNEWWSVNRTMDIVADYVDADSVAQSVMIAKGIGVSGSKITAMGSGTLTLPNDTVVTIKTVIGGGSSAPILSWLGIEKISDTIPAIDTNSLTLNVGGTGTIKLNNVPAGVNAQWSSSNTAVATVENGTITAIAQGTAEISVTIGGYTLKCAITVNPSVIPEPPTLSQSEISLFVNATHTLTINNMPSGATVYWASDASDIASVENGIVTAVAAGATRITATIGEVVLACNVTVADLPPEIVISKTSLTLKIGETDTLALLNIAPEDEVVWSTSDESIASVKGGLVTALAQGEAEITATLNEVAYVCAVTVSKPTEPEVPDPSFDKTQVSVELGDTAQVTINNAPPAAVIEWSSDDAAIATVANGLITPVAKGETTIKAKIGDLTLSCKVNVLPRRVPVISATTADVLIGRTTNLTVTNIPSGASVVWSSANDAIATVSSTGVVTGVAKGKVVITAHVDGLELTCAFTVSGFEQAVVSDPETGITVSGSLPENSTLNVARITSGDARFTLVSSALPDAKAFTVFDISVLMNGAAVQPNGIVKVKMPLPANYTVSDIKLYYIDIMGNRTSISFTIANSFIEFEVSHFSLYAIAEISAVAPPSGDGSGGGSGNTSGGSTNSNTQASNSNTPKTKPNPNTFVGKHTETYLSDNASNDNAHDTTTDNVGGNNNGENSGNTQSNDSANDGGIAPSTGGAAIAPISGQGSSSLVWILAFVGLAVLCAGAVIIIIKRRNINN